MPVRPRDQSSAPQAIAERKLRKAAEMLLRLLERPGSLRSQHTPKHVGVFLLGSKAMRELKRGAWRLSYGRAPKRGKPVDVLAFPHEKDIPYPEVRGRYLGDVYINYEAYGERFDRMLLLLVHGTLHLLGYRHERKRGTMAMEHMERTLWRHLSLLA